MNRKFQILALVFGLLMALINVPAFADRTPDWMVGTFEGSSRNDGVVITVRINSDGGMTATGRGGTRRNDRHSAAYRKDIFTVDGFDYRVQKSRNGFLAVATDKRNGEIDFRRVTDPINDRQDNRDTDRGSTADQRIPTWMTGAFEGTRRSDGSVITLRINSDGAMNATGSVSNRRSSRLPVTYRRNVFTVDGFDYRVQQSRNGFLAVATDKRNDEINFRRTGDYSDDRQGNGTQTGRGYYAEQQVPTWMVGSFEGSRPNDGALITLRISSEGAMSATTRAGTRRANREIVTYKTNLFTVGGFDYRVQRSRNGFLAVATDRRNSEINFRRTGDYLDDPQDDRTSQPTAGVPDWMIGRFDGRSSKNGQIINLRVTRDGRFSATDRLTGQNSGYFTVSYRRNLLTIDGRDYRVERNGDGFRAVPVNDLIDRNGRTIDPYGQINFRRFNPDE